MVPKFESVIKEEDEKMNHEQHTEIIKHLTKLNERQITLFNSIKRVDANIQRIFYRLDEHEKDLVMIKTYGTVGIILLPIIVNIVMRMI